MHARCEISRGFVCYAHTIHVFIYNVFALQHRDMVTKWPRREHSIVHTAHQPIVNANAFMSNRCSTELNLNWLGFEDDAHY